MTSPHNEAVEWLARKMGGEIISGRESRKGTWFLEHAEKIETKVFPDVIERDADRNVTAVHEILRIPLAARLKLSTYDAFPGDSHVWFLIENLDRIFSSSLSLHLLDSSESGFREVVGRYL